MGYLKELLERLESEALSENINKRALAFGQLLGMQQAFWMLNDHVKSEELERVLDRVDDKRGGE